MCGITGILDFSEKPPVETVVLQRMLGAIAHRGPDEAGLYRDSRIGMGNVRLSIIDLAGGLQPIPNEDESLWIVYNGETYNYVELRRDLISRGHRFSTETDTEVVLHLYEEYGLDCLSRMNGQFAFAIWDRNLEKLLLARDRVGIRPLFYTAGSGALVFGSEIKAILASGLVRPELDPMALDQIFTFWTPLPGRTVFKEIRSLPPGSYLLADREGTRIDRYWKPGFPEQRTDELGGDPRDLAAAFKDLLEDATRLRLRSDVTVGAYLSGGIDSSTITALTHRSGSGMQTFSIAFEDKDFDERQFQEEMVAFLRTEHHRIECKASQVGEVFPSVIRHTEMPILRTSPAPMYLLSGLVEQHGIKVVLTGEGSDEILGGYNIFREAKVRRFWANEPSSRIRPLLLQRLYDYIPELKRRLSFIESFFGQGLTEVDLPWYSHMIRWENTARLKRFFSPSFRKAIGSYDGMEELAGLLPGEFSSWRPLSRAQFLEMTLFMSEYLLSAQGDRMLMGHSVEGRFPFLDHRVIEFCSRLPARFKICGLREKHLLKNSVEKILPLSQRSRPKQPYRAPISPSFLGEAAPAYVARCLSEDAIEDAGCFEPRTVGNLVRKGKERGRLSETEQMALTGIISTQIVFHQFIEKFSPETLAPLPLACLYEKNRV